MIIRDVLNLGGKCNNNYHETDKTTFIAGRYSDLVNCFFYLLSCTPTTAKAALSQKKVLKSTE